MKGTPCDKLIRPGRKLTRRLNRWADGRKYWSQLIQTSRNLARTIWVNTSEREGEEGKVDLLRKLYVDSGFHRLSH